MVSLEGLFHTCSRQFPLFCWPAVQEMRVIILRAIAAIENRLVSTDIHAETHGFRDHCRPRPAGVLLNVEP